MDRLPFFGRFRARLTLLVLLLVVPAFGLVLYGNLAQRRIRAAAVEDGARGLAQLAAANHQDIVDNTRQLLDTLTKYPFLVLATNRPVCEVHLSILLKLSPDYTNFGLIETNGWLFCNAVATNARANLGDRSYFQGASQTRRFSVGEFQVGRLTKEPSLNFACPVFDGHSNFTRVLFTSLKLRKLSEAVAHIQLPAGGTILVTDRQGTVVAQQPNPEQWVGKSLGENGLVRRILAHREPVFAMPGLDALPRLHAVSTISDGQSPCLFLCVSLPMAASMAQANRALVRNCVLLGLVAVVVLGAAWFYSQRFFLQPVKLLASAANSLAAGDLSARVGPMPGAGELVQLGGAFNEMAQRLEARQADLLKVNEALKVEVADRKRAEEQTRQATEEQTRLQQQLLRSQRMESLGALAGGIAHDLNNALAPILMSAELLREHGQAEHGSVDYLNLISNSARRCTQMVKQILGFAKGSRGQGLLQPGQLIGEMSKIANDTFPKSILIRTHVPAELWSIQGNSTELHQVLLNLCVNARDAMPQGGTLEISAQNVTASAEEVRAHVHARPGPYVVIGVRDTGTGIEPHLLRRIFEPFFTTKGPEKGTGLGLSTAAEIVRRHGGFIEVESEPGRGTQFKLFLPASRFLGVEVKEAKPKAWAAGHGELILVVDDEQSVLELVKTTLESYGYRVATAANGLEAIAAFEAHKDEVRLVVTDNDMPLLDGSGTVRAIKKLSPQTPIIMASGTEQNTECLRRLELVAHVKLVKPYSVEQLLDGVARALEGSSDQKNAEVGLPR